MPIHLHFFSVREVIIYSVIEAVLPDSKIVKAKEDIVLLHKWVSEQTNTKVTFKLLWQGSRDGYTAAAFHNKCNNQGATLTVIVSDKGNVFGGYTKESWGYSPSGGTYKYDSTAFVYSLTHKTKCARQKNQSYSICDGSGYGPIFGGGCDIIIVDNCNTSNYNYCRPNHSGYSSYELPPGADNTYLAGSCNFYVKEIEVYSVT